MLPVHFSSIVLTENFNEQSIDDRIVDSSAEILNLLPLIVAGPIILYLLGRLAVAIERMAERKVLLTMQDALRSDSRAPIVFLRSFADDQVELPNSKRMASDKLLQPGTRRQNLDRLVLQEGFAVGPVVTLGKPGEPLPPYGAARGYFDHQDWQQAVTKVCGDAKAIIMCLDESDAGGVWWEVNLIAQQDLLKKTLFLVHPRFKDADENKKFLKSIAVRSPLLDARTGISTLTSSEPVIAFCFNAVDDMTTYSSPTFGELAYRSLIRLHLSALVGVQEIRKKGPELESLPSPAPA